MKTTPIMKNLRNKLRSMEWGQKVLGSAKHISSDGSIMQFCQQNVLTIQKNDTIKHAAGKMLKHSVRRLFITDPDKYLQGTITATDIVDFLGGGERFKIVEKKHNRNLLAAINEPVRSVMENAETLQHTASIEDALVKLHETGRGGIAVLSGKKIVGVVTERDYARILSKYMSEKKVKDLMSKNLIFGTKGMTLSDTAKVMIRNGFRRLPILHKHELVGIVTSVDILNVFMSNISQDVLESRIEEIMHTPLTINQEELAVNAAELMKEHDIGGLPVVSDGKVVGIITERDLLKVVEK